MLEEKWDKLKGILKKWLARLKSGKVDLFYKELLSDRGFLVYVTRNYTPLISYLKGFNFTIEMWRGTETRKAGSLGKQMISLWCLHTHGQVEMPFGQALMGSTWL